MFATSAYPGSVAVGDFNGDGKLDVVTSGASVLLGSGDGTFTEARTVAVGSGPTFVVVSDLNRDGVPDLVAANSYSVIPATSRCYLAPATGCFGGRKTTPRELIQYPLLSATSTATGRLIWLWPTWVFRQRGTPVTSKCF